MDTVESGCSKTLAPTFGPRQIHLSEQGEVTKTFLLLAMVANCGRVKSRVHWIASPRQLPIQVPRYLRDTKSSRVQV